MEYGFAAEYGGKAFLNEYISLKNKKIIVLDQLSEISKLIQDKSKKIFLYMSRRRIRRREGIYKTSCS